MSVNIDNINKKLKSVHGVNAFGEPLFRVVFSDTQTEKRFGVYREFYGDIFLREFKGVRECPKYSYLQHMWILERYVETALAYDPQIPDTSWGSYEPVYVFQDANGQPLPVVERFIDIVIQQLFAPKLSGHRKAEFEAEESQQLDAEVEQTQAELEEAGRTWIGHRLHSKEGIVKP